MTPMFSLRDAHVHFQSSRGRLRLKFLDVVGGSHRALLSLKGFCSRLFPQFARPVRMLDIL